MSRRCAAGRPGSSRRGMARRRSCSRMASASAPWSTATGCDRLPSRSRRDRCRGASRPKRAPSPSRPPRRSAAAGSGRARCSSSSPAAGAILEDADAKAWVLRACRSTTQPRPVHEDRRRARAAIDEARRHDHRRALPRRPGRGARPARHQDDGARGPRTAVEHGRRHADGRPWAARPAGRRSPSPGLRPGHEPGDRPGARARGHGPAGGAGPSAGAARRTAARATDRPPGTAHRRGPRRSARLAPMPPDPDPTARRDLAGRRWAGRP